MFRCKECHKVFLGTNENTMCKNCINHYINQAQNIIVNEIEPDILSSKNVNISIVERHTKIISAQNRFEKMLTEKSGIIANIHIHEQISNLKHNIEINKNSVEKLIYDVENSKNLSKSQTNNTSQASQIITTSQKDTAVVIQNQKEPFKHEEVKKEYAKIKNAPSYTTITVKRNYSKTQDFPNDYIVFDLETTGFNPATDRIIEIGAVKYIDGVEKEKFHSYVNPECHIPANVSAIHNIYDKTVKDAPTIKDILPDFLNFIQKFTLIAHNSDFDMSFIQTYSYHFVGETIKNDVIDTLKLAREYLYELPNKKLETIKNHFNINVGSHNSMDDCIVTAYLYQFCRNKELSKYKYGVRSNDENIELSQTEVLYLNKIIEILELNKIHKSILSIYKSKKFLVIYNTDNNIYIKLKLHGNLQYILLDVPIEIFDATCTTKLKHTAGTSDEGNTTRLFIQHPEQLYKFTKYILKKY